MELRSDLHLDLQYLDEPKHTQPNSYRQQYIGPWVQPTSYFNPQKNQVKYQSPAKPKKCDQNRNKNVQLLATMTDRRQRFRTTMHKVQSNQKISLIEQKFQSVKKLELNLQDKIQRSNLFTKYQPFRTHYPPLKKQSNTGKIALNTTMYIYHYKQKPKKSHNNTRNSSFDPQTNRKKQLQLAEKQASQGNKNLQRILKMKQRLRSKNHNLVRKIRQKQIQSDKQIAIKHLLQAQQVKNARALKWRSATMDHQYKINKYELNPLNLNEPRSKELKNFHPYQYNKTIFQSDLNLNGTSKNKFFHHT